MHVEFLLLNDPRQDIERGSGTPVPAKDTPGLSLGSAANLRDGNLLDGSDGSTVYHAHRVRAAKTITRDFVLLAHAPRRIRRQGDRRPIAARRVDDSGIT